MPDPCPLCVDITTRITEPIQEDPELVVLETMNKKGHHNRFMVVFRWHVKMVPWDVEKRAREILKEMGKKYFYKERMFCILEPTFASVKGHWHLVCSDMGGLDASQIKDTPKEIYWIRHNGITIQYPRDYNPEWRP